MEATMLLCDRAQVVDGKLYILGGGWGTIAASEAVGRPAGTKAGSAILEPVVLEFEGLPLPVGGYVFELATADRMLARTPFRVC
jgi:hypothetical protein